MAEIDTADIVHHGPTGEDWVVARVKDDRLAWVGWPQGWATLADCTLVRKATEPQRAELLRGLAGSKGHHCAEWAKERLKKEHQQ